jgi:hypothetical protein
MASYLKMNLPDPEKLIQCPYNSAHQILKHRFAKHLIKCRRSNGESVKTVACQYNSSHVYPESEIKLHEKTCESKIEFYRFMYKKDDSDDDGEHRSKIRAVDLEEEEEENWDNECAPTYDPTVHVKSLNVVRTIQHMTPSVRKTVREAEKRRLEDLNYDLQE